ncbi:unnamed protein product [marine sediment metagenome]|uniref:Uncharacterized protein n=1 Tax=marine sediment metagenome TaxID=412755 RepID=X0S7R8_9ZZZZ
MTIQQAYDTACRMDPEIFKVINGRESAKAAAENNKTLADKRTAASSIHGAANAGDQTAPGSIREALANAWDDAS